MSRYLRGMIWQEAADEARVDDPNAWKRRSELVNRGWIEIVYFRGQSCKRCSTFGKRCLIYRITWKGREEYKGWLAGHPVSDVDPSHRRRLTDPETSYESSYGDRSRMLYQVLGAFYYHTKPRRRPDGNH